MVQVLILGEGKIAILLYADDVVVLANRAGDLKFGLKIMTAWGENGNALLIKKRVWQWFMGQTGRRLTIVN